MRKKAVIAVPLVLASLFGAGCAGSAGGSRNESAGRPEPRGNDEVMRDDTGAQHGRLVQVTLEANPEIHIGQEQELGLRVRVTNLGDAPIAAEDLAGSLRVDDLPVVRVDAAGHGWITLDPGESAEWDAQNLGVRLFDEPGEHSLRLELGDVESAPVRVNVSE